MATTREQIDSRGKSLLQLLTDNEEAMANVMNPSAKDQEVYHGPDPDNPVDILYPRSPSEVGADIGRYTAYFLREFNLDGKDMRLFGTGRGTEVGGDGILTQTEHDAEAGENAELTGLITSRWQGKISSDKLNHPALVEDNSNFMKLKGRKSLLTLYWEMRGAFVDNKNRGRFAAQGFDGQNKTFTNRYSEDSNSSGTSGPYDSQFYINTGEIYFPPSNEFSMAGSAANGFNLGQPLGPDVSIITNLIEKGKNIARDFFERQAALEEDQGIRAQFLALAGQIIGPPTRVSQLFRPGWERPNLPRREVQPLTEILEQNILLPPNNGMLDVGGANSDDASMSSTFGELYLNNRAEQPGYQGRFRKGTIAGTGINELQEPLRTLDDELVEGRGNKVTVPFTYADDADRLNHYKKMAGFTSNSQNVQSNPGAQEPAVFDIHRTTGVTSGGAVVNREGTYRSNAQEVIGMGENQYFPFTFSTVNKKNSRLQICTLQATMQSLAESYTPTWQSKHFFGRSEQVHTYTFTDRTIDISFVIFADSMRQLQNVYERVLWLAQQCYPDYSTKDRIGSGPIIAMRVGDLFQYKAGFIRSLSYDWSFLGPGGKWELTQGMRMPQGCNVTMSYQIIHEKVPDRDYNFYGGPAGGLAAGVRNQKQISWNAAQVDITDIEPVVGHRYIPPGVVYNGTNEAANIGERVYLDHIENTNSARFDADIIPDAVPIDEYTGDPDMWPGILG